LTPFTAALIHGGFFHLAMNMLMLVVCGTAVERVLGGGPLIVLYLAGALAAGAGQFIADPGSPVPMIGASGAVSAVIAVYAMLFSRNEVKAIGPIPTHWVRALWLGAGWIVVQLLIGFASIGSEFQIAIAAHIGGFLIGLVMARPLLAWRYRGA
jgi:membrane associated rhomboid family serine protease